MFKMIQCNSDCIMVELSVLYRLLYMITFILIRNLRKKYGTVMLRRFFIVDMQNNFACFLYSIFFVRVLIIMLNVSLGF